MFCVPEAPAMVQPSSSRILLVSADRPLISALLAVGVIFKLLNADKLGTANVPAPIVQVITAAVAGSFSMICRHCPGILLIAALIV